MPRGRIANTLTDFWKYVEKTSAFKCWLWKGPIHHSGYGAFNCNKNPFQAHRVAYYLSNPGKIDLSAPTNKSVKQFVLHRCDVRACCNPAHLFLGSIADNTLDMVKKDRHRGAPGETNPASKLSHKEVRKIRRLLMQKQLTQWQIARKFGVSQSSISFIKRNITYAEIQ